MELCSRFFPGAEPKLTESPGRAAVTFNIWQFQVHLTTTTAKMSHVEKVGETWYELRLLLGTKSPITIRKELGLTAPLQVERCLMGLQQYLNSIAAEIQMSQVDPYTQSVDLLGNGATTEFI
jgi:hypothetical protein